MDTPAATHAPQRWRRLETPRFSDDRPRDARLLGDYVAANQELISTLPDPAERSPAQHEEAARVDRAARRARHEFLDQHVAGLYDDLTANRSRSLRLDELVFAAADRVPGLVPTPSQMATDREAVRVKRASGEVDQGVFFAYVLRQRTAGEHLLRSMLAPTPRAVSLLAEFRRTGRLDLGQAVVERDGSVAEVTICNQHVLNAEDDAVVEALETAVDLALLDDTVSVGVLRGASLTHPRYCGRRVFGAGINLTHLYQEKISFVDFMLRRELGYIRKLVHGLSYGSTNTLLDLPGGKPWVGAVESFAIGGAAQIALVLDRVVAGSDAYFSLPAATEGIIPGAANLRLGRLIGRRAAQRLILFGERIDAVSPEARALCDEVHPPDLVDGAVDTAANRLADLAVPVNRRMIYLAEESDDLFRTYMSRYALEQAERMHSPDVVAKLRRTWAGRRAPEATPERQP